MITNSTYVNDAMWHIGNDYRLSIGNFNFSFSAELSINFFFWLKRIVQAAKILLTQRFDISEWPSSFCLQNMKKICCLKTIPINSICHLVDVRITRSHDLLPLSHHCYHRNQLIPHHLLLPKTSNKLHVIPICIIFVLLLVFASVSYFYH